MDEPAAAPGPVASAARDLDRELAELLEDMNMPSAAGEVVADDAVAMEALTARVAALERRLDATLDAFEAEVEERMAAAAAAAAQSVRAALEPE